MTTKKRASATREPKARKTPVVAARRDGSVAAACPATLLTDSRVLIEATRQTVA